MEKLIVDYKFDLNDNMDLVKSGISESLNKYRGLIVTEDTVSDMKKVMAKINKEKEEFSNICKEFIYEIERPIIEFKEKRKETEKLFDEVRSAIKDQVEIFEEKRREEVAKILAEEVNSMCKEKDIEPSIVQVQDLIKLSAVTKSGSLTKQTREIIEGRISEIEAEMMKVRLEEEERQRKIREEAEEIARKREAEIIAEKNAEIEMAKKRAEEELRVQMQNAEDEKKSALETQKRLLKDDIGNEENPDTSLSIPTTDNKDSYSNEHDTCNEKDVKRREYANKRRKKGKVIYCAFFEMDDKYNEETVIKKINSKLKDEFPNSFLKISVF